MKNEALLTLQGLSHYTEHMLFMGSKSYPDENEFSEFLVKMSGNRNAYTEAEHTNYHLDVHPAGLYGALQRFAGFFTDPLFKVESLQKEVCIHALKIANLSVMAPRELIVRVWKWVLWIKVFVEHFALCWRCIHWCALFLLQLVEHLETKFTLVTSDSFFEMKLNTLGILPNQKWIIFLVIKRYFG